MRFLANGPSIPDELLLARDEGWVVFFCGAGVSRAWAGLSDFSGLAETVIHSGTRSSCRHQGTPTMADTTLEYNDCARGMEENALCNWSEVKGCCWRFLRISFKRSGLNRLLLRSVSYQTSRVRSSQASAILSRSGRS